MVGRYGIAPLLQALCPCTAGTTGQRASGPGINVTLKSSITIIRDHGENKRPEFREPGHAPHWGSRGRTFAIEGEVLCRRQAPLLDGCVSYTFNEACSPVWG